MKIKAFFLALLAGFILNACGSHALKDSAVLKENQQTITLKFIETSDVHGMLLPFDFKTNQSSHSSLAQIFTFVKQERQKGDQQVVLMDNGDILQGQPLVYYYNFEKTNVPHISSQTMNSMQYDVATIGNHDIEAGHAVYDRVAKEFHFPLLAANVLDKKTGKPYFAPYTVIERKGLKIAVLGLTTPYIPNWLPEKIWSGMVFEDMIVSAKKWVPIIQQKEKPHLIVGLFHAGTDAASSGQDPKVPLNENASKLVAEQVPGFDLIFVGHDHLQQNIRVKNQQTGKEVLILGPSDSAKSVAAATAEVVYDTATQQLISKKISGKTLVIDSALPADPQFVREFAPHKQEILQYLSKPIGKITATISTRPALFGDSEFVDLIHLAQLDLTKAEISLAAPLTFDTEIKKGKIFIRDMFSLYKFENLLYTMKLSGQEIKNYLEFSYGNWFEQMKSEKDHLLKFAYDASGKLIWSERDNTYKLATRYYDYDSAAGIHYTVDVTRPAGNRVKITALSNGHPFKANQFYRVAINSYRGNGGGGHLVKGAGIPQKDLAGRMLNTTEKDLRFYMMKWIEKKKIIHPKKFNNWKLIPESWAQQGARKDFELLYKK